VEIFRRNFLASMVPVIVNAILNEHQLVIDIVSFVQKGDFHRSRLGEKQRGKILAGWVTRKMRTIAQYSIRDPNGQDAQMISEEPGPRASMSGSMLGRMGPTSLKAGSTRAPSLMGMTANMNNPSLTQQQQQEQYQASGMFPQQQGQQPMGPPQLQQHQFSMSNTEPQGTTQGVELYDPSDRTPTDNRHSFLPDLRIQNSGPMDEAGAHEPMNYQNAYHPHQQQYESESGDSGLSGPVPDVLRPGPLSGSIDNEHARSETWNSREYYGDGMASYGDYRNDGNAHEGGEMSRYMSNGSYDGNYGGGGGGGLRVANRDSTESGDSADDTWRRDALAQINFAGGAAAASASASPPPSGGVGHAQ
jgi:hypothetical protein